MQLTLSAPNKKGKHFLKTTQPNNIAEAKKMPPRKKERKSREPKLHKLADKLTEILIYFMVIFSSWAFGTTELWSNWIMNISAYIMGLLLLSKYLLRFFSNYSLNSSLMDIKKDRNQYRTKLFQKVCTILLACGMLLLLSYILTSAVNERASFNLENKTYTYNEDTIRNLPHSYDARSTWIIFFKYLAIITLFWAVRDWLIASPTYTKSKFINHRLKRLFFIICINGGLLGLESILQRIYYGENTGKLLFTVIPNINFANINNFGPFAYRSNAAAYYNLIWPISFILLIRISKDNLDYKNKRFGNGPELILIPCIILCASCPIISSSRGGALVMMALTIFIIITTLLIKSQSQFVRATPVIIFLTGILLAYYIGSEKLESRLLSIFTDNMSNRLEIYDITFNLIREYGFFGSGPGTFETVMQFELNEKYNVWESWAHNDYLEFYLTFGIPGVAIKSVILALFLFIIVSNFLLKNSDNLIMWGCVIAILGLLVHAVFDFPLKVYSILILFTIIISSLTILKPSKL